MRAVFLTVFIVLALNLVQCVENSKSALATITVSYEHSLGRQKYQSTQSAGNNDFDLSNEYSGSGDDAIAGYKSEYGGHLGFEKVGYECSYEVDIDLLHSIQIVGAELSRPTQPMKLLEKQRTENTKGAEGLEIKSYRMTATVRLRGGSRGSNPNRSRKFATMPEEATTTLQPVINSAKSLTTAKSNKDVWTKTKYPKKFLNENKQPEENKEVDLGKRVTEQMDVLQKLSPHE